MENIMNKLNQATVLGLFRLTGRNAARIAMICVCLSWLAGDARSQLAPQRVQIQFGARGFVPAINTTADQSDIESGAILKTDPDLEAVLETAERMRKDGNYRVATQLWQAVLQRSGDALYSSDGSTYFSLIQQVEAILAGLPAEGLAAYRVRADAEAKEIMAQASGPTDINALNKVVRQYFVSSLGDEAAYDLGCIYLDRYDFIGARRMFEKVVRQHPDPSMSLDDLYTRIALCQSFLGDVDSAKVSLAKAEEIRSGTEKAEMVRNSLGELASNDRAIRVGEDWQMRLGSPRRVGTMRGVPDEMMEGDLAAIWQFYFEPKDKYSRSVDINGAVLTGENASGESVLDTLISTEEKLIDAWRNKSWRPAGHLMIEEDRVYFKTGADLSVWSRKKIEEAAKTDMTLTKLDNSIQWRSVWRNAFQIDDATKMMETIRKNWGAYGRRSGQRNSPSSPHPTSKSEVQLFGDQIFQQMSIYNNVLYSIEGKSFDKQNSNRERNVAPQWNASYRRTRSNFLTAYDSTTGEVLWSLPKLAEENDPQAVEEEESPWLESGGFMAAPIGYGELVLAPVNNGGAISIYAIDPSQEGKTVWKSFLCDEPETGAVPWSAVNLSIDGSDLFVNCGMGVVFVLDPATGTVRFAKRYRRVGKPDEFQRRSGWTINRLNFSGWSSDIILPYGRQMICFSSDNDAIEAFDRNNGTMIWRSEMSPIGFKVDYILGIYNDMLYAAGNETIVAYDLQGEGRMIWGADQIFDGKQSLGRGVLTPKGIYMPVEDSIYHFDLAGDGGRAKILGKVHVDLGTNAPVGNLYSDGDRFWVHGANRLYALGRKQ